MHCKRTELERERERENGMKSYPQILAFPLTDVVTDGEKMDNLRALTFLFKRLPHRE